MPPFIHSHPLSGAILRPFGAPLPQLSPPPPSSRKQKLPLHQETEQSWRGTAFSCLLPWFALSTLQCWCPGSEAWPGPYFWEGSSELPSAYSCPPGTGSMSLLRVCTAFTRLPLESWDPGPLTATQQPKPPSRARVRSGIWPWGWASGVLCGQWRQSLESRAGLSALCDVGQNQGRKG